MKRSLIILTLAASLAAGPALAGDYSSRAAVGGALGGALGAYVGAETQGRNGALLGGVLGAAVGTAIATDGYYRERERVVVRDVYREPVVRYRYDDRYYDGGYRHDDRWHRHYRPLPPGHARHWHD